MPFRQLGRAQDIAIPISKHTRWYLQRATRETFILPFAFDLKGIACPEEREPWTVV
jgi:hypothetical protein